VRIGDRERRRTEQRLRASYLRGELSADTFEGRVGAVYAATHAAELAPLAADLPRMTERLRMSLARRPRPDGPALVAPRVAAGACLRLGRDRTCHVRFVEHSVSRDHAELRRTTSGWVVVDRASTNGTYVNGVRVQRAIVGDGDEIRLGAAKLIFRP
jgi:pSer/pThr/pTyr-binding forkhead associated (FHA) protein